MEETTEEKTITQALESLTVNPTPSHISTLATASRSHPEVRQKLADYNVLRTLVDLVEFSLNETLETTCLALRCIGNACFDNDTAREYFATELGFGWAIQSLHFSANGNDSSMGVLTFKVLYNIASDNERTQKKMYEARVHYALWKVQRILVEQEEDLPQYAELLLWVTSHKAELEPTSKEPAPVNVTLDALEAPRAAQDRVEGEGFAMLVEAALSLLRNPFTQHQIVETSNLKVVLDLVLATASKLSEVEKVQDSEQTKILAGCWTSLLWCLSDIAANPRTVEEYPLNSSEVEEMVDLILVYSRDASGPPRLPTAACQFIGNLLWNLRPQEYVNFVERNLNGGTTLYAAISRMLVDKDDVELLHAASGLLVLLSRASVEVRERIGAENNTCLALDRLCHHEKAELKADGAQLLKALGRDCLANQSRYADLAVEVHAQRVSATPG